MAKGKNKEEEGNIKVNDEMKKGCKGRRKEIWE